jgi:hypothetical protein
MLGQPVATERMNLRNPQATEIWRRVQGRDEIFREGGSRRAMNFEK